MYVYRYAYVNFYMIYIKYLLNYHIYLKRMYIKDNIVHIYTNGYLYLDI